MSESAAIFMPPLLGSAVAEAEWLALALALALAAWPQEINELVRSGRPRKAEKLQDKLGRLRGLT
jgi:hypothetical protein